MAVNHSFHGQRSSGYAEYYEYAQQENKNDSSAVVQESNGEIRYVPSISYVHIVCVSVLLYDP
jgi:hypothetical protein